MMRFINITVLIFLVISSHFSWAITCDDQLTMYRQDRVTPGLAEAAQNWHCPPGASLPVPKNQSSSYGLGAGSYSGGGSFEQQMAYGLMQGLLSGLMQGIMQPSQGNRPQGNQIDPVQQKLDEEKRKAEWQAKVEQQILEMEQAVARQERESFNQSQTRLFNDLMAPGGASGGSGASQAYRQACLVEMQLQKAKAMQSGDEQFVKRYNTLYQQAEGGDLSVCGQFSAGLPVPTTTPEGGVRGEVLHGIRGEIDKRLPLIEKARKQKEAVQKDLESKEAKVRDVKEQVARVAALDTQATEAQKNEVDALEQAALKELENALALDREADKELGRLDREINSLEEMKKVVAKKP